MIVIFSRKGRKENKGFTNLAHASSVWCPWYVRMEKCEKGERPEDRPPMPIR